ncbi:MAG: NfeD family protein [Bdellovibrionia bacterium]
MKHALFLFVGALLLLLKSPYVSAQTSEMPLTSTCLKTVSINGAITAATFDYLQRAHQEAVQKNCGAVFVKINTPGGNLQSTRLIVEKILASPIPYLCLISPVGGHAGSAGAILLQACHVSGGLTATHLGAATPILGTGQETPQDLRNKMVNDTVSWLEGVTELRGRNKQFSKEIITLAKSVSVEEAVKIKALDIVAENEEDFLKQTVGRVVLVADKKTIQLGLMQVNEFKPDFRTQVLDFFADPEFSYLIFMGSLALLYAEITNPGLLVPGVVGSIGLIISLISFHKLEVEWAGVALLLLGLALLVAELFVTSFGILGIGGVVSLFLGSMFLFTVENAGFSLPLTLIASVVGVIALIALGLGYLTLQTLGFRSKDSDDILKESLGVVLNSQQVEVAGDIWNYTADEELAVGDRVKILERHNLILRIEKYKQ